MVDKISPSDSRIQYKTAELNGITYSYILSEPDDSFIDTIFLIHGWPDLSLGWRYQIPLLTSLGFRVIVPDMMGYGGTEAPDPQSFYTVKRAANDIAALAAHLGLSSIILGGHDWGGIIVFRTALYHPKLVSAIFSVCTPFMPPTKTYVPTTSLPNFKYGLQFAGPEVEANIVGEEKIRQLLSGLFGGRTPEGEVPFSVREGVLFDRLPRIGPSPLLSKEEMDFYVKRYAIHGFHGPLNWYRNDEQNFADEREIVEQLEGFQFQVPALFIAAKRDAALPLSLSERMERWFVNLTKAEVDASHWALWEKPIEVNQLLKEFLQTKVGGVKHRL